MSSAKYVVWPSEWNDLSRRRGKGTGQASHCDSCNQRGGGKEDLHAKGEHVVRLFGPTIGILLMVVVVAALAAAGDARTWLADCQDDFTYLIETDDGGYYALVGLPLSLRSQYTNHTIQIYVDGTYSPSDSTNYVHPDTSFRGVIYVSTYVINGATFTFAQTAVIVSGTITSTTTYTSQVSPTTITGATGPITLTPISVNGLLDYTPEYCVTTLHTTNTTALLTSSSSAGGNSSRAISGFTAAAIILGLVLGLSLVVARRKPALARLSPSRRPRLLEKD